MNPNNIPAQVIQYAKKRTEKLNAMGLFSDALMMKNFTAAVENHCVHFQLPEGGKIFDDDLRGIRGQLLRLPYRQMTLSFHMPKEAEDVDKVMVYAFAIPLDAVPDTEAVLFPEADWIGAFLMIHGLGVWHPAERGIMFPARWDSSAELSAMHFDFLGQSAKLLSTEKNFKENMGRSLQFAHRVVLEFLEAMMCSNVEETITQKTDRKINERREKKGALPLYETRILTLTPGQGSPRGTATGTGTGSPKRPHLRRGHIRILQDQRRIWVNSCVVGSKGQGGIDKGYSILKPK